jgi:Ca2+-transporting ATPase
MGGVLGLMEHLAVSLSSGLSKDQVLALRAQFGTNVFPATPVDSYLTLLLGALSDTTLLILLAAAAVSFAIGYWQEPETGWIDGAAIFVAVFLVSNISAGNDYSKQLQFLELEKASEGDERASVYRDGQIERINPVDLVVGDILVLQVVCSLLAHCCMHSNFVNRPVTRFQPTRWSATRMWLERTSPRSPENLTTSRNQEMETAS